MILRLNLSRPSAHDRGVGEIADDIGGGADHVEEAVDGQDEADDQGRLSGADAHHRQERGHHEQRGRRGRRGAYGKQGGENDHQCDMTDLFNPR